MLNYVTDLLKEIGRRYLYEFQNPVWWIFLVGWMVVPIFFAGLKASQLLFLTFWIGGPMLSVLYELMFHDGYISIGDKEA